MDEIWQENNLYNLRFAKNGKNNMHSNCWRQFHETKLQHLMKLSRNQLPIFRKPQKLNLMRWKIQSDMQPTFFFFFSFLSARGGGEGEGGEKKFLDPPLLHNLNRVNQTFHLDLLVSQFWLTFREMFVQLIYIDPGLRPCKITSYSYTCFLLTHLTIKTN